MRCDGYAVLFVLSMMLLVTSSSYAAGIGPKELKSIEQKMDSDKSLSKIVDTDELGMYLVLGTRKQIGEYGHIASYWLETLYKYPGRAALPGKLINAVTSTVKLYCDCRDEKMKFSTMVYHGKNGKYLGSVDGDSSWDEVVPETIGATLCGIACYRYNQKRNNSINDSGSM